MNPGEIYTAPDGRKYRAEGTEEWDCVGCDLLHDDADCHFLTCTDPNIHFKRITKDDAITYTLIESLRTGKSCPGGMPDSNSFHEGAKAMAIHLGYEVESHAKKYPDDVVRIFLNAKMQFTQNVPVKKKENK